MPYTFRHFLASPRGFLGERTEHGVLFGGRLPRLAPPGSSVHAPEAGTELGGQCWHAGPACAGLWLQPGGCQAALRGDTAGVLLPFSVPRDPAPAAACDLTHLVGVVTVACLGGSRRAQHWGWGQGQWVQQARQLQVGEGGWCRGHGGPRGQAGQPICQRVQTNVQLRVVKVLLSVTLLWLCLPPVRDVAGAS